MRAHLAHMLVGKVQAVGAEARRTLARDGLLVALDHLAATAGVPRHRVHADREVGRQHLPLAQRAHQRQEAGRIAARVGHSLRRGHRRPLRPGQLREAVDPARRRAVRCAGVDHAGPTVADQPHGLAGGGVRQAEHDQVDLVDDAALDRRILRRVSAQADQLDLVARGQALTDLETGRAMLAIDVDAGLAHSLLLSAQVRRHTKKAAEYAAFGSRSVAATARAHPPPGRRARRALRIVVMTAI